MTVAKIVDKSYYTSAVDFVNRNNLWGKATEEYSELKGADDNEEEMIEVIGNRGDLSVISELLDDEEGIFIVDWGTVDEMIEVSKLRLGKKDLKKMV